MGWGSMWAQARNAFYKKTGINKKLPAMLGQRAAAAINKRPAPRAAAAAINKRPAPRAAAAAINKRPAPRAAAQAQPQAKNNNMLYLGGAALLAIKFLL